MGKKESRGGQINATTSCAWPLLSAIVTLHSSVLPWVRVLSSPCKLVSSLGADWGRDHRSESATGQSWGLRGAGHHRAGAATREIHLYMCVSLWLCLCVYDICQHGWVPAKQQGPTAFLVFLWVATAAQKKMLCPKVSWTQLSSLNVIPLLSSAHTHLSGCAAYDQNHSVKAALEGKTSAPSLSCGPDALPTWGSNGCTEKLPNFLQANFDELLLLDWQQRDSMTRARNSGLQCCFLLSSSQYKAWQGFLIAHRRLQTYWGL